MKVILAETAGFCMGVKMALDMLDGLLDDQGNGDGIHTLGPIIHNPQVLERYRAKGVATAEAPEDVPTGDAAVIRAHGVPRELEQALRNRGTIVMDATCPRVKKAQRLIADRVAQGRTLLLYGEADHPEVKGLLSYADADARVFGTRAELDVESLDTSKKYVLAAQTTQDRTEFHEIADELEARADLDVDVLHTICDATRLRQEEAMRIAAEADCMVVVGGRMSGNTRRLVQVCQSQGTKTLHVEIAGELPLEELRDCQVLGLTAGASTPKSIIVEVYNALSAL